MQAGEVKVRAHHFTAKIKMKQFQNNASDILRRMKHIDELCDVTLVSNDGETIMAHKVVLASASSLFMEMFQDCEDNKGVSMKGVQTKHMNAMIELIYNGETEIKLTECEAFLNILEEYRVASKESLSEEKEDTTSKTKYKELNKENDDIQINGIMNLEKEIKSQKQDILKFQKTFTQMKAEILKLRAENKVLKTNYVKPDMKDNESNDSKENKCSKNIDSKTQKESTFTEKVTDDYGKAAKKSTNI